MARIKGMLSLSGNLEVNAQAPLDARTIIPTEADLTVASNFPYPYIGLEVYVTGTEKKYRLVNLDTTQSSSWHEITEGGGSGGGHTIEGDGTPVTDRDTLNFKDMSVSDDSQNEKTDVKPHRLTQAEMEDIISPLPFFDFSNPGAEAFVYSTNERVIGQWIDGKPLYQKCVTIPSLVKDTWNSTNHNIQNVDKVVKWEVYMYRSSTNGTTTVGNNSSFFTQGYANRTVVEFYTSDPDTTGKTAFGILRYTKTTDSAVATGEKIVGQWIDGKPLYEKILTGTTNNAQNTDVNHNIANIDTCVSIEGGVFRGNGVVPFGFYNGSVYLSANFYTDNLAIRYDTSGLYYNQPYYAKVRYTKS